MIEKGVRLPLAGIEVMPKRALRSGGGEPRNGRTIDQIFEQGVFLGSNLLLKPMVEVSISSSDMPQTWTSCTALAI